MLVDLESALQSTEDRLERGWRRVLRFRLERARDVNLRFDGGALAKALFR
jgi:hypothetical protein